MFPDKLAYTIGYKMFWVNPKEQPHESPFLDTDRSKEWQRGYNAAYFENLRRA